MIGVDRGSDRYVLGGNFGGFSLHLNLLIDGTDLQNDVFDEGLGCAERYCAGPCLEAVGARFDGVGSRGKLRELVMPLRIGHCRLRCWSRGRTRQFYGDSRKNVGCTLPGYGGDPAGHRGLGNS